jgi:hypothetical protein
MSSTGLAEPTHTVEPTQRRRYQLGDGIAGLMGFEAATLAAAAFLHLHGDIQGRSTSFDSDTAGIAEADQAPPNFLDPDEGAARLRTSYGDVKFHQLVALKDKYDPENVFSLNANIPPSTPQPR